MVKVIQANGTIKYYQENGCLHKEGGPALILLDGSKEWWENGLRHRLDGPAVSHNNFREFWVYGKLHRLDGPAIEFNQDGINEYYINGIGFTYKEFEEIRKWL